MLASRQQRITVKSTNFGFAGRRCRDIYSELLGVHANLPYPRLALVAGLAIFAIAAGRSMQPDVRIVTGFYYLPSKTFLLGLSLLFLRHSLLNYIYVFAPKN